MKKFFWIFLALVIAALFVWTAFFLYKKSQQVPEVFETTSAFQTDIVKKTVATGKIIPRREIEIKPQVSGVVETLFVEAGEEVKKGALLARIELIPNMEQLSNAESRLETAILNLNNAQFEHERQKSLFDHKLISENEYKRFLLNYNLQKENVRAAENAVDLIKEGASKDSGKVANLVRSTVEGMVLLVPVREGTFVTETNTFNQGTTIAHVADMTDLVFEGLLDESEIGKVHEGMDLVLKVGAIDEGTFAAELEYVSPKGVDDQGTIKFEIKAAVVLPENAFLRAGYSATADIVLDKRENVWAINEGNLIIEDGKHFVEVETAAQQFARREVTTGLSDGINIEILSGLDAETKIKKLTK